MAQTSLTGRVCLVTGATGGIGGATVEALAERGGLVVASGRDEGRLADLARSAREARERHTARAALTRQLSVASFQFKVPGRLAPNCELVTDN